MISMQYPNASPNHHVVALVANERGARVFEHLIDQSSSWIETPPLQPDGNKPSGFGRRVASFIDEKVDHDRWLGIYVIAPKALLDRVHSECSPHARLHFIDEKDADLVHLPAEELYERLSRTVLAR